MHTPFLLLTSLGLLTAATSPPPRPKPFDCGTNTAHAPPSFLQTIQSLHRPSTHGSPFARAARDTTPPPNSPITIDTVFHIVAKTGSKASITNAMPAAQLDSLNESYKPYSISFNLLNVTWSTNDAWAVGEKDDDLAMKKALRQGTYSTLNIYFQTDLSGGMLGRCTLPSALGSAKQDPTAYVSDGCNVNAHTMPSGSMEGYNAGKTAVHEAGHWLGLLHTFEGYKCDGPGDYIDDTPVESVATDGCPVEPVKRSCPEQQGSGESDPVHNFMDYSTDKCYEGFTGMQVERMRRMWGVFREGN